jgi:hypothetical protein
VARRCFLWRLSPGLGKYILEHNPDIYTYQSPTRELWHLSLEGNLLAGSKIVIDALLGDESKVL